SVLATLAWDVVGAHLCDRFGFDRAYGPRLEVIDGCYGGQVAELFDELSKRDFAVSVAAELGVELGRCAAVGDGRSDVPLFAEVGLPSPSTRPQRPEPPPMYRSTEPKCVAVGWWLRPHPGRSGHQQSARDARGHRSETTAADHCVPPVGLVEF